MMTKAHVLLLIIWIEVQCSTSKATAYIKSDAASLRILPVSRKLITFVDWRKELSIIRNGTKPVIFSQLARFFPWTAFSRFSFKESLVHVMIIV